MLRYCAWCGSFVGVKAGEGHQVRENRSEIDTATICSPCFAKQASELIPVPQRMIRGTRA